MPEAIPLLEAAENEIERRIQGLLGDGEEELIRVSADLDPQGYYGEQWVVVTPRQVVVLPGEVGGEVVRIPMDTVTLARTEPLVGGGRLEIEREGLPTVYVPYSNTQAIKFTEAARGIEQLRKSERFGVQTELERTRCASCGRLLPERNGICPACIKRLATLGRIAAYLKPYRWRCAALAVASVFITAAELVPPLIYRRIVDDVLDLGGEAGQPAADRYTLLGFLVLALVGVRLITWGAEWLGGWTVTWLSARVTADIRSQLYRRLELLSLQYYDKRQVGAVMSRVTRDSERLQDFLVDGMPYLVINGLMLLGILGVLLAMSWQLTLYVLIPVPVIILWGMLFWRRMHRFFMKWMQAWSDLMARVNEVLSGIRVVKAFAQEPREIEVFGKRNQALTDRAVATEINWAVFFSTTTLFTGLGVLIVWYYGGREVLLERLTLGTLLAFYSYMWLLYGPLQWFGEVNSWMTRAFAGAERIFEVIDTPPEAYEDPDAVAVPHIEGRVRFRKVTFGYDKSKPVLHEIDLDVAPGEMIGLVGKSGVGKTTAVNLICRFYDVDRGGIEVDGVDIRRIRLLDLRNQIGIVLQDPILFSGTIAENIGYGKPGAAFDEIIEAGAAANAHDFIVAKPDGYDTQVGERGSKLSVGEKQRVSLARAILHNPRILILDEATSSVDVQTEVRIQQAIARLVEGRTTFAIAHRLSTLRNASRLVVLEAGRIAETGTHEELMERQGVFAKLVKLQQEVSEIIGLKE